MARHFAGSQQTRLLLFLRVASAAAAVARGQSAIATAEAQLADARSRQALAADEARRYIELGKQHFVSQSVVDGKLQLRQSADAQVAAAQSALASAREDLARLQAERAGAQQQRSNIRLLAPVDGVVVSRDAEPGSTVIAGQAVLKLQEPGSLWVTVRLDQGRSAGLRAGLPADIVLRSSPSKGLSGKVARVEPISDSVTEERIAQVAFDTLPPGVSSNEMADVTLHLPAASDVLVLPNAALRHRGAETGVWLRADGTLRFVPVKTGAEGLDGKVQIVDGLKAGDEVVVYSERELKDDSRIKVVDKLGTAK
jgi:HlyD family secretion protein